MSGNERSEYIDEPGHFFFEDFFRNLTLFPPIQAIFEMFQYMLRCLVVPGRDELHTLLIIIQRTVSSSREKLKILYCYMNRAIRLNYIK